MADIFNSQPGKVVVINDPNANVIPGRIVLKGAGGGNASFRAALVGGVDYGQSTNQQFQEALDGSIFIYVFGDHMGAVKVKGMAFPATCDGDEEGLAEVLEFYKNNRASAVPTPVTVLIGTRIIIKGFLTRIDVTQIGVATGPDSLISEYTLTINALPGA